ncbi:esterase/lipase family protein [Thermohalobacter berrensis]|uniref:Uncharacterized protein n=1 Tax=Thermohalobacter berrensis TaxID=99594 RepID=A0A419SV46_9FIRM|nr:hypothetical protein [Thermohalobacter berrensis]RKD29087.1 hypothetical protein BET03_05940 [Thermohalobacter berrensis]
MVIKRLFSIPDKKPIVFIPGLFGSLGDEILPGTGKFSFGLAEHVYRPIIDNLEELGYKKDKDLFIAFYDWRKDIFYCTQKYLIPTITKVKEITGAKKVNLVCHSLGGLVARAYIQSYLYAYDVDKLILFGTPNRGSVDAYYFWEGGNYPEKEKTFNFLYQILWEGFVYFFKLLYGEKNELKLLHNYFPSIKQLLPSYDYGDYIFYESSNRTKHFIPIQRMEVKNEFLNTLNRRKYQIYLRGVRVYLISSKGYKTNKFICVDRNNRYKNLWIDGKPFYNVTTLLGDGTVTNSSAYGIYGKRYFLKGDHVDILKESKSVLTNIFNRRIEYKKHKREEVNYIHSILAKDVSNIEIMQSNKGRYISEDLEDGEVTAKRVGKNNLWVLVKQRGKKGLRISFTPLKNKKGSIVVCSGGKRKGIKKIRNISKDKKFTLNT